MTQLKYLCNKTHYGARLFLKDVVYLFSVDPGSNFILTDRDPVSPTPNYGTTDKDGTWYPGFIGWDDLRFPATRERQGVAQKPDYDYADGGLLFPNNNPDEIGYMEGQQFPHRMLVDKIYPHVHVMQNADTQAVFKLDYRVWDNGTQIPAAFTTITTTGYAFDWEAGGRLSQILIFPLIDLVAAGIRKTSSMIDMKLYRDDAVYVGDMLVKSFDIHIPVDAPLGSGQHYEK